MVRDRIVIIFCAKPDPDIDGYITTLAEIFSRHTLRSITSRRRSRAVAVCDRVSIRHWSNRKKIPVTDTTITKEGEIRS